MMCMMPYPPQNMHSYIPQNYGYYKPEQYMSNHQKFIECPEQHNIKFEDNKSVTNLQQQDSSVPKIEYDLHDIKTEVDCPTNADPNEFKSNTPSKMFEKLGNERYYEQAWNIHQQIETPGKHKLWNLFILFRRRL